MQVVQRLLRRYTCCKSLIRPHWPLRAHGKSLSTRRKPTKSRIWAPVAFTLTVGGITCVWSGIHAYESVRSHERAFSYFQRGDNEGVMKELRKLWWDIGPASRFFSVVLGINALVFISWQIPSFHGFMEKHFVSGVENKGSFHLLLSTFSHQSFWHIFCNMVVLSSFLAPACAKVGDYHCCASIIPYYLTAGAFSATVGYYAKLFRGFSTASLGASGAIYAVVTMVIMAMPNSKVYLLFFPFIPINASMVLGTVVALDMIGLVKGWQLFDHAAHLGGFLFAILYGKWLHEPFNRVRGVAASAWKKMFHRL